VVSHKCSTEVGVVTEKSRRPVACILGGVPSAVRTGPHPDVIFLAVKPRAPGNLTVHGNISNTWLLTWSNPYPPGSYLYKGLTYLVNISREDNPADVSDCVVDRGPQSTLGMGPVGRGSSCGAGSLGGPRDPVCHPALLWASLSPSQAPTSSMQLVGQPSSAVTKHLSKPS
jgi:hypothetical protein